MIHALTPDLIGLHRRMGDAGLLRALNQYSVGQGAEALDELCARQGIAPRAAMVRLCDQLLEAGAVVVTALDAEYPVCLRELERDAPPLLYIIGSVARLKTRSVAIIGTRSPAPEGRAAAKVASTYFSEAGWCVVSGNAPGVDAAAHSSAVACGGETLMFPPVPLDQYKQSFRGRFPEQITVASCFAPGMAVEPWMFLRRNTLVAGHCLAAFVAETGTRGGTLDTVKKLRRMGRDIFATELSESAIHHGAHAMLAAGGAQLLEVSETSEALQTVIRSAEDRLRRPAVATHVLDDLFPDELLNDD